MFVSNVHCVQFGTSDIATRICTHRMLLSFREFRENRRGMGLAVLKQVSEITFRGVP